MFEYVNRVIRSGKSKDRQNDGKMTEELLKEALNTFNTKSNKNHYDITTKLI
jgi:hypothetical protein